MSDLGVESRGEELWWEREAICEKVDIYPCSFIVQLVIYLSVRHMCPALL